MSEELKKNVDQTENEKAEKKSKMKKPILTETDIKIRKAKRTKASVAAFVLLLAVGVMGNWYYENTDLSSKVQPLITSSSKGAKTLGEAEYVDATTEISEESTSKKENEYFSTARLERQNARDEALEKLQMVVSSTEEGSDAKTDAEAKIAQISSYIGIENKIETLVTAKGVNNCLAVVSDDGSRVDVIVDVEELTDTVILQIKEVAMEQLGCSFENVSIVQSK